MNEKQKAALAKLKQELAKLDSAKNEPQPSVTTRKDKIIAALRAKEKRS